MAVESNLDQIRRRISRLEDDVRRRTALDILRESGLLVARNAQFAIKAGGKGRPLPSKLTSRTGTGRRSIRSEPPRLIAGGAEVVVGTNLRYMALHETGGTVSRGPYSRRSVNGVVHRVRSHTARYPRRPFLEPGLRESRRGIELIIRRRIDAALDGRA